MLPRHEEARHICSAAIEWEYRAEPQLALWHCRRGRTGQPGRLLGAFIDPAEGVRSSKDLEVNWGSHPLGDKRTRWATDDGHTTMVRLRACQASETCRGLLLAGGAASA